MVIVFKLTELSRSCSKGYYTHFNYLNKTAIGESLVLYFNRVFKKVLLIKSLVYLKKNAKENKIKF